MKNIAIRYSVGFIIQYLYSFITIFRFLIQESNRKSNGSVQTYGLEIAKDCVTQVTQL
jgi:hypothetical protein